MLQTDLSQCKLIAFDLDGTLVDSVPDLADALNRMLAQLNLPQYSEEQVRGWIGNGVSVLVKRALCGSADYEAQPESPLYASARESFNVHYSQLLGQYSQLYPQVFDTLTRLHGAGYRLAVVTNKPHAFTLPLLKHLQIFEYFDFVLSGDSLAECKPHPLPLTTLAEMAECELSEMLMVGDSKNDILCAQAANIASVGVTYGYNYGTPISDSRPNWVIEQFEQLLALLPLVSAPLVAAS